MPVQGLHETCWAAGTDTTRKINLRLQEHILGDVRGLLDSGNSHHVVSRATLESKQVKVLSRKKTNREMRRGVLSTFAAVVACEMVFSARGRKSLILQRGCAILLK